VKSFLQYITETQTPPDPYDWDTGYGKRFKFVHTPQEAQDPPQGKPTVSLVTPVNSDAWNWPEVDPETRDRLRANWGEIQQGIAPHKRIQIETGRNVSADEVRGRAPVKQSKLPDSSKQDDTSPEQRARQDTAALRNFMNLETGFAWRDGDVVRGDLAMGLGKSMDPTANIHREKAWNTDVGLAFDEMQDGIPMGNPAGFKAVHQRHKEGRGFNLKTYTYPEYREELLNRLNPFSK
jgi:hypothetical protein